MHQTKFIQPRLEGRSLSLLAVLLLASLFLFTDYGQRLLKLATPEPADGLASEYYGYFLIGLMYGWTATGCWLLSVVDRRYLRWFAQLAVVVLVAYAAIIVSGEPRFGYYFSSMGGLVFAQTLAYHLLNVPPWQPPRARPTSPRVELTRPRRQFGIGEIIAATTCIAVLFAIAIRSQRPGITSSQYWLVLIGFWALAPLMSASVVFGVLNRRGLIRTAVWFGLSLLLVGLCAAGLTAAEWWLTDLSFRPFSDFGPREFIMMHAFAYGIIAFSYLLVFAAVASIGRWQAASDGGVEAGKPAADDQAFQTPSE
jgi:hypothetical protein